MTRVPIATFSCTKWKSNLICLEQAWNIGLMDMYKALTLSQNNCGDWEK